MLNNVSWTPRPADVNVDDMDTRTLQRESSRALAGDPASATSDNLYKYNASAPHNSRLWYQAIVKDYIKTYGGLPSKVGPGTKVRLILDE